MSDRSGIQAELRRAVQLHQAGQFALAEPIYRQILAQYPGHADALQLLGVVMHQTDRQVEAIDLITRAIAIAPNIGDWHSNLGGALRAAGRWQDAVAALRRAVQLNPDSAAGHFNLGNALADLRLTDEAIAAFQRSLSLRPNSAECWNNLGIALKDRDINQAVECYRRAVQINPKYDDAWSNLLLGIHYRADDPGTMFAEHLTWGRQKLAQLGTLSATHASIDRAPDRRLRVGYVSPDFREHSVSYFSRSFLREHDRSKFEIFCYDNTRKPDQATEQFKACADHWRRIVGMPDDRVADMIREDRIDILVDLAGHSGANRLPVFARKPAPVQMTYLGYPNTTGLATIDYRITDATADPPGLTDAFCVERLIRLPHTAWCYTPSSFAPAVGDLPALTNGYITFASFNNLAKLTPEMLTIWARIVLAVPNARLLIKADGLHDRTTRDIVLAPLLSAGLATDRIELLPRAPDVQAHLQTYNRVDIGLDTFPYHGTTTTCEAFWMGVPVVTLLGNMHVSRVSASLLTSVGLPGLIATSLDSYTSIAIELAKDLKTLEQLRAGFRARMSASPLTDAPKFTRALEDAYRHALNSQPPDTGSA